MPNNTMDYGCDSAGYFYWQLETIVDSEWSVRCKYDALRDVFRRVVDQGVAQSDLHFTGTFAKLDFLIKENSIPHAVARAVNDTRLTLNALRTIADDELADRLPDNVKATALLVHYAFDRVPLPSRLGSLLPDMPRSRSWGRFDAAQLRCVVDSWDEEYIYVTGERDGENMAVCYGERNAYLSRNGVGDWSYLGGILHKGAQLNLVRLRFDGDVCMPELIIYEPDYLVNVTTVASCFETYAESPDVNLVSKLKPQPNTKAIHLGNLAGQYLDDTVHHRERPFPDGFMDFYRKNAISLIACDYFRDTLKVRGFQDDALCQKMNVERLVGHDLQEAVGHIDYKSVVLEPTFFSEMLGLQGRFDFLYDKDGETMIVEQKSGKGGFSDYGPAYPRPRENHLVQLILYRTLYIYEFNKHAADLKHIFLLYSKYEKGLVAASQDQDLMLRAIKMRNLLAWSEMQYAELGFHRLAEITPDDLNQKHTSSTLWQRFTRPELEALLSPVRDASPVEKAYYLRFMQFVAKEHLLSKLGTKTRSDSGFASIWLDSLDDKIAAGSIYDRLSVGSFRHDGTTVVAVSLLFHPEQNADSSNFRKGDIVMLYPYDKGGQPDACAQMVIRGSIADISAQGVVVALRNPQADERIFTARSGVYWALEHDMFDSSVGAQYRALHQFLEGRPERRSLLLGQREPRVDTSLRIRGDYNDFNTLVTRAVQSRELFIVIGPPGTGKTSFGLLNILREELLSDETNVLLLSYTNRAVDEICGKLVEDGIDFLRIGTELSCEKAYCDHLLSNRLLPCRTTDDVERVLRQTRVVCSTTASLNSNASLFKIKHFDLAIVDEASQILEPQLVGLLSARSGLDNAIDRVVLIGDHKQLPAVVMQSERESRVDDPELWAIGLTNCRRSLFERLLSRFKTDDGYDPRFVYMLTRQGRMHREIAEFPNLAFYAGRLDVVPCAHQTAPCQPMGDNGIAQLLTSRRVAFVASEPPREPVSTKTNSVEAEMIAAVVRQVYLLSESSFSVEKTVGVIVPYRNQIATVRNAIDRYGIAVLHDITIDTVERYQGSQRDYIVYGFTVQQPSQLNFLTDGVFREDGMVIDRKLNVAMTRARLHLMLVGNPALLSEDYTFAKLIDFAKRKDSYFDIPTDDFIRGNFHVAARKEADVLE